MKCNGVFAPNRPSHKHIGMFVILYFQPDNYGLDYYESSNEQNIITYTTIYSHDHLKFIYVFNNMLYDVETVAKTVDSFSRSSIAWLR
jgi:hypothetical protein